MTGKSQRDHNRALALAREEARQRMTHHLHTLLKVSEEQARDLLQRGKAWASQPVRELDAYLADRPDGLSIPTPDCPLSLARLLPVLREAGHGHVVGKLACARCGSSKRPVRAATADWRCYRPCSRPVRTCARCARQEPAAAIWEDGPVCYRCYSRDPRRQRECSRCGQQRPSAGKTPDGGVLCYSCWPRRTEACARCGQAGRVRKREAEGPVCTDCYTLPPRRCGGCGTVGPIQRRAADGRPDLCRKCDRIMGECVVCGRTRRGANLGRNGGFHCGSCRPRPVRLCVVCNRERPVHVTWPLGAVCGPCCIRRRHHPGTCAFCREPGTLVGRTETGDEVCGTCCGGGPVFTCVTCNSTGNPYAEGRCTRCTLRSRVDALLAAENAKPWMERLAHCLANAPQPRSVIHWLDHSQAGRLLASLVTTCTEPTHDVLDDLPQEPRTRYVRGLLVAAKVLPERNEYLAQTELWLARTVDSLPPGQRGYVHAFAEWHVLNRARRQADRGRFSDASATHARTDILRAIYFLDWLGGQGLALATAPQSDLDRWITEKPGQRNGLVAFIRWSRRRRITGLRLTASLSGLPQTFLEESELHDQLHRCLTDDELPLEVRVSGALVRLFGLPVSRVADLTVAAFTRDETGAYLTISTAPVLLPPRLAALVEALVILRRHPTAVGPAPDSDPGYLFPGKTPGRPRSANAIRGRLTGHGLGTLAARNSAMAALMTDLPPQIVSDLLGFSPDTTTQWAAYFQDSWAHYLAARSHPESP